MIAIQFQKRDFEYDVYNLVKSFYPEEEIVLKERLHPGKMLLVDTVKHKIFEDEELKEYLRLLSDKGPQVVIITSVPVHDEPHKTSVYAYNRQGNRYWKVTCPYLPAHYPGTGDTFTSVITGSLMQGDSLPMALDRATQFILQGIRATFGYEYDNREGILLEKVLHNLDMPIQMASYELI